MVVVSHCKHAVLRIGFILRTVRKKQDELSPGLNAMTYFPCPAQIICSINMYYVRAAPSQAKIVPFLNSITTGLTLSNLFKSITQASILFNHLNRFLDITVRGNGINMQPIFQILIIDTKATHFQLLNTLIELALHMLNIARPSTAGARRYR